MLVPKCYEKGWGDLKHEGYDPMTGDNITLESMALLQQPHHRGF